MEFDETDQELMRESGMAVLESLVTSPMPDDLEYSQYADRTAAAEKFLEDLMRSSLLTAEEVRETLNEMPDEAVNKFTYLEALRNITLK